MSGRALVIVKAHYWDQAVAEVVEANRRASGEAAFIVLFDTSGNIEQQNGLKYVEYCSEIDHLSLGLYKNDHHRPLLWYNGDYTLYYARQLYPDVSYYVVCEYDCLIRGDITRELNAMAEEGVDFAAAQLGRRTPDWAWYASLIDLPGEKYGCILPFVFASARAIDVLFEQRIRMSVEASASPPLQWPFCEGFIPTVLEASNGMKVSRLEDYFDLSFFRVQPSFDPATQFPETVRLVHPLLDANGDQRKRGELETLIRAHRVIKAAQAAASDRPRV